MLGVVAGSPGYSAILLTARIHAHIPSVEYVFDEIFGAGLISFHARILIGADELARKPHLVVVHILYACDRSRTRTRPAVNSVDVHPVFCAGI